MPIGYRKTNILLQLEPEIVEEIDRRCGGPARPFQGPGRAGWVIDLVYRELGISSPPRAYHKERRMDLPLHLIDHQDLHPLEKLLVTLALRGNSFKQISDYLVVRRVVPMEGCKKWYPQQVERVLNGVIARNLVKAKEEVEA